GAGRGARPPPPPRRRPARPPRGRTVGRKQALWGPGGPPGGLQHIDPLQHLPTLLPVSGPCPTPGCASVLGVPREHQPQLPPVPVLGYPA
ncbi:unnamed protein product, partial [Bubo scandiacus]